MAELSEPNLKQIVQIFLISYNQEKKSSYRWIDGKSYTAKHVPELGYDAQVFQGQNILKLQHKRIVWDKEFGEPRRNAAERAINYVIESLQERGMFGYTIHLNFYSHIPDTKEEKFEFAFWLQELITYKDRPLFSTAVPMYSYDKDDDIFMEHLKKYVSYVHVFKRPENKKAIFGFGWSNLVPNPLPNYGDVVALESQRLLKYLRNNVAILEADTGLDDYDFNLAKEGLRYSDLRVEVWVVENFLGQERARCVYSPKTSFTAPKKDKTL